MCEKEQPMVTSLVSKNTAVTLFLIFIREALWTLLLNIALITIFLRPYPFEIQGVPSPKCTKKF